MEKFSSGEEEIPLSGKFEIIEVYPYALENMAPSVIALEQEAPSLPREPQTDTKMPQVNLTTKELGQKPVLDPSYKLLEQPIGTRRPIRVVSLGAGYSGLMMGIMYNERMKHQNTEFVIYERNEDLGGTWFENR